MIGRLHFPEFPDPEVTAAARRTWSLVLALGGCSLAFLPLHCLAEPETAWRSVVADLKRMPQ